MWRFMVWMYTGRVFNGCEEVGVSGLGDVVAV